MVVILKRMTRPTGKINSATIFTKKVVHILIVPTRRVKFTMTKTSPSPANKVKPVLKRVQKYEEF